MSTSSPQHENETSSTGNKSSTEPASDLQLGLLGLKRYIQEHGQPTGVFHARRSKVLGSYLMEEVHLLEKSMRDLMGMM